MSGGDPASTVRDVFVDGECGECGGKNGQHEPYCYLESWGQSIFLADEPRDAFAAAELEKGRRFAAIYQQHALLWQGVVRDMYRAALAEHRRRRRQPWWARLAGRGVAAAILIAAIRDGLRR